MLIDTDGPLVGSSAGWEMVGDELLLGGDSPEILFALSGSAAVVASCWTDCGWLDGCEVGALDGLAVGLPVGELDVCTVGIDIDIEEGVDCRCRRAGKIFSGMSPR